MKRLLLLEDYPPDFQPLPGDTVIALSDKASFWLEKHKQPYRIVTDYGSEIELQKREEDYWREQLAWLDRLDEMLWGELPELKAHNIRPAIVYGRDLKGILDAIFIRCVEAQSFLKEPYDLVALWRGTVTESWSSRLVGSLTEHRSLTAQVLPLVCAHWGLRCEEHVRSSGIHPSKKLPVARVRSFIRSKPRLRSFVRAKLRRLQSFNERLHMRGCAVLQRGHIQSRPRTLLFLDSSYDLGDLLVSAYWQGHRCLVLADDKILDASGRLMCPRGWSLPSGVGEGLRDRVQKAAAVLCSTTSPIWRWPSTWFDFSVNDLLADHLREWLIRYLPQLIQTSDRFACFYEREGVDFVLTPSIDTPIQAAAIAGAGGSNRVETVLIAHGDGPDVAEAWDLHELFPYDHYFVPDKEFAEYFRQRKAEYLRPTASVHVGSARWPAYSQWSRKRYVYIEPWDARLPVAINHPPGKVPQDKPIVVYVVARPPGDNRYLNQPNYSETWYYQLQTCIIKALVASGEFTVVVKMYPGQDSGASPIPQYVAETGASNLFVSQAVLRCWVPWADRFLFDKPSTSLYQIALAGAPFHLLLYRGLKMRDAAMAKFSEHLTYFQEFEEAADAVRRFLAAPVSRRPVLTPEGPEILTTLMTLPQTHEATVGRS